MLALGRPNSRIWPVRSAMVLLAAAYLVLYARHPYDASSDTRLLAIVVPAVSYILPALFCFVAALTWGTRTPHKFEAHARHSAVFLTLMTIPYLIVLGDLTRPAFKEVGANVRNILTIALIACFLLPFLSFSCTLLSRQYRPDDVKKSRPIAFSRFLNRGFQKVVRPLRPSWLVSAGLFLVLSTLFLRPTGLYVWQEGWITSISDVTQDIAPVELAKNLAGRSVYALGLGFAAATIVFVAFSWRKSLSKSPRLCSVFSSLAAFLAIYSAVDLNFGWLGLFSQDRTDVRIQFGIYAFSTLLVIVVLLRHQSDRYVTSAQALLAILVTPAVLYDAATAPMLVGTGHDSLLLPGLVAWVAGLQFLWWGFSQLQRESSSQMKSELEDVTESFRADIADVRR